MSDDYGKIENEKYKIFILVTRFIHNCNNERVVQLVLILNVYHNIVT
jgi:hypothetical protein